MPCAPSSASGCGGQQLGRSSRLTLTRRSVADAQAMVDRPSPAIGVDRNELEHLSMLAQQGELDEAIGLLEARVEADRTDRPARELLGDLYERKADQAQGGRDPAAAIGLAGEEPATRSRRQRHG